jgi:hypothetical protein
VEDTDLKWRTSSYSSNGGGNCVEVAGHVEGVAVRDTQARSGVVVWFSPDAWRGFTGRLKAGS